MLKAGIGSFEFLHRYFPHILLSALPHQPLQLLLLLYLLLLLRLVLLEVLLLRLLLHLLLPLRLLLPLLLLLVVLQHRIHLSQPHSPLCTRSRCC